MGKETVLDSPPRIAIQISGHLKDVCRADHYRGPAGTHRWTNLANAVADCRKVAVCDVFLVTFSTLFPVASKHDSRTIPTASTPAEQYNISHFFWRSYPCLDFLDKLLMPTAVKVDTQPQNIVPALGSTVYYRGSFITSGSKQNATASGAPLLAGVRASVHAVAAAARLRREHCRTFGCADAHDAVLRMRPDVYDQVRCAFAASHRAPGLGAALCLSAIAPCLRVSQRLLRVPLASEAPLIDSPLRLPCRCLCRCDRLPCR